ncbi:hypothetical protein GXW71_12745 [Roseomonas hellenica]|uniref:Uncharacterized protein n=1 Tax=Plastoroseomonas hellenica TaxID=2687306 RepID=A0ABS5EY40_9PROT|nr:hypothetical protein [Plastoroseomonas hellenica]MBR0665225.1 hypothetical protein [Plastoroseomonas hellenica]
MIPTNVATGYAPPAHARPVPWWGETGWAMAAEEAVDRFDRPLTALVEAVRHAHDIGERPDFAAARRRLARIEARLVDQLQDLGITFDSRAHAALEMARGKARATQEWLAAMAAQPLPEPGLADAVIVPTRRAAGAR